eukprot:gene18145-19955_t
MEGQGGFASQEKQQLNTTANGDHDDASSLNLPENSRSPSVQDNRSQLKTSDSKINIKDRKRSYKKEKQRVAKEVSSALKDSSVVILSSWLKIRGTLKSWSKFWCVMKPGLLFIYKSHKHHHWVGTVVLSCCEVMERPSSKEGFCFKLFHPLKESIWTAKGPKGEIAGSIAQPMPRDHLILRASSNSMGDCWIDAIEVAQKSSLLNPEKIMVSDLYGTTKDSNEHGTDDIQDEDNFNVDKSDVSSLEENAETDRETDVFTCAVENEPYEETDYSCLTTEYLGEEGEATEEMEEDNKSILWALLKQVRPGMDLSKVTLPTFILEPRSFLDKLADYYYHIDYLASAAMEEDPYTRMKSMVKWYLSGFYKKPKGLKKPYNPIIGELFKCMWPNPKTGTRTFFVAEQVSHHPPVSAFYCSNRKDGYVTQGSILAKSKFYGNSSSAILDGTATVSFLRLGEDYLVNMPYAHIKGILLGTLTAELGGTVVIRCEKTAYSAEIEFKLKPFWKKTAQSNRITGKIKMGKDVLSKIEGTWDGDIFITEYSSKGSQGDEPLPEVFFNPDDAKKQRLKRYCTDVTKQEDYESEKLWAKVTEAIRAQDQEAATREKLVLEDQQRELHRELKETSEHWKPRLFELDALSPNPHAWVYKYRDLRPWDLGTDLLQYEHNGVIKTVTRHVTPVVKRSTSIPNMFLPATGRSSVAAIANRLPSIVEPGDYPAKKLSRDFNAEFDRSSLENAPNSSDEDSYSRSNIQLKSANQQAFEEVIRPLVTSQDDIKNQLTALRLEIRKLSKTNLEHRGLTMIDCHPRRPNESTPLSFNSQQIMNFTDNTDQESIQVNDGEPVWIFGYGSLIWKTNFPYSKKLFGFIRSYSRRFWQGSTDHRGVPGKPGRVATLIKDNKSVTWGMAYEVLPRSVPEVMAYLDHREKGGYTLHSVQFYPKDGFSIPFKVLVYIATESNEEYLGDAPLNDIAKQIATSRGPSGENSEYLLRLAQAVRVMGVRDDHLFELETRVTQELINNRMLEVEKTCNQDKELLQTNKKLVLVGKQNTDEED